MEAVSILPESALPRNNSRRNIYDLSPAQLGEKMREWGEPDYRARQVLRWLYKEYVLSWADMTNLPSVLRERLAGEYQIGSASLVAQKISTDGWTRKVLLRMKDGNTIETVLMLYNDRATVCVSSQVGCAMGCNFCATGQMGFTRNLSTGELLEQVIWFNRWLREHPHRPPAHVDGHHERVQGAKSARRANDGNRTQVDLNAWFGNDARPGSAQAREISAITNIVFMGMGEPLVNYNNLWAAMRTLNSPEGLGLGARRMTVSTVGIAPQIRRFGREDLPVNLAVSLHAASDELRSSMMPINSRYDVRELIEACRDYVSTTNRRITFEYVLISGVNDSREHARMLGELVGGMLCHVNLIPLNPVPGTGLGATRRSQVFAFQKIVEEAGISTTVRIERGVDIAAACGQLKVEEEPGTRRRTLNPELLQAHVQANLASSE